MERKSYSTGDFRTSTASYVRSTYLIISFVRYGTILGATFAAMFPVRPHSAVIAIVLILHLDQDKIERMVIDGVADAENYYAS